MPISAIIIDKFAQIDTVNERTCVLLSVPCAAIRGKHLGEVFGIWDAKTNAVVRVPLEQVFQLGLTFGSDEVVMLSHLGKKVAHYSMVIVPMLDDARNPIGAVVTVALNAKAMQVRPPQVVDAVAAEPVVGQRQSLYVRSGGRYVRILLSELLWVEAMENYVQLQTAKEKIVVHATLKSMVDALTNNGFQRIHRSFIVKKDEIERIEENNVVVKGTSLPIGKSYRSELLESLTLI